MKPFINVHPKDLVTRMLMMGELRNHKPEKIKSINPRLTEEYNEVDEKGKDLPTVVTINWEYCIFDATLYELENTLHTLLIPTGSKKNGAKK